jgi:hypothetical protein
MMEWIAEASPRFKARIACVLSLLSLLTAGFTEIFLRGRLNYAGGYIAIIREPKTRAISVPQ